MKSKIKKISSLNELNYLAHYHDAYRQLAMISARNLGGSPKDLNDAMQWLNTNAMETDEEGVVREINFCRDLVKI